MATFYRSATRFAALSLGLIGAACSPADSTPPKLWESTGFANPESALYDSKAGVLYVSNVNGEPPGKDGNGYISKVGLDGKVINEKWATGMDAPKGLALAGGKLYAADIDKLVEIDEQSGKVLNSYAAQDAKFLNDVAAAPDGSIYVSDMATNTIWRLADGKFEAWLNDAKLENPNGLLVKGNKLIVGAWGVMSDGFATKVPGHLKAVDLTSKEISSLGDGKPLGNLDGIEPLGDGFIVTDWMAGKVLKIGADGAATTILELGQGAADIGYDPASKTLYVPQMMKGVLLAYKVE